MTIVRPEQRRDAAAVRRVNEMAFGRPNEAALVETLRASGAVAASFVVERAGAVVGHVLFSPVSVETAGPSWQTLALGPMAVLPELQRHGFGTSLGRAALDELRARGETAVVVVGHPSYYPRFGFVPASRFGLRWEVEVPDDVFMALELVPGALAGKGGVVRYRREFSSV
jgi:putative acetyltransferase